MRPANERRRYIVTSSPIGWVHTQNDPCYSSSWQCYSTTNQHHLLLSLPHLLACQLRDYIDWPANLEDWTTAAHVSGLTSVAHQHGPQHPSHIHSVSSSIATTATRCLIFSSPWQQQCNNPGRESSVAMASPRKVPSCTGHTNTAVVSHRAQPWWHQYYSSKGLRIVSSVT